MRVGPNRGQEARHMQGAGAREFEIINFRPVANDKFECRIDLSIVTLVIFNDNGTHALPRNDQGSGKTCARLVAPSSKDEMDRPFELRAGGYMDKRPVAHQSGIKG